MGIGVCISNICFSHFPFNNKLNQDVDVDTCISNYVFYLSLSLYFCTYYLVDVFINFSTVVYQGVHTPQFETFFTSTLLLSFSVFSSVA